MIKIRLTTTYAAGMPGPLPSSIATGAPPAMAVSGAAAETTKNATPRTPRVPRRNWWESRWAMSELGGAGCSLMVLRS